MGDSKKERIFVNQNGEITINCLKCNEEIVFEETNKGLFKIVKL